MLADSCLLPIAAIFTAQVVRWCVWIGLVGLTLALLAMVRTSWGQSQPLRKCIALSLLVHLLLGIYMTTVNIVMDTGGSPDGQSLRISYLDDGSDPAVAPSGGSDDEWATEDRTPIHAHESASVSAVPKQRVTAPEPENPATVNEQPAIEPSPKSSTPPVEIDPPA